MNLEGNSSPKMGWQSTFFHKQYIKTVTLSTTVALKTDKIIFAEVKIKKKKSIRLSLLYLTTHPWLCSRCHPARIIQLCTTLLMNCTLTHWKRECRDFKENVKVNFCPKRQINTLVYFFNLSQAEWPPPSAECSTCTVPNYTLLI